MGPFLSPDSLGLATAEKWLYRALGACIVALTSVACSVMAWTIPAVSRDKADRARL